MNKITPYDIHIQSLGRIVASLSLGNWEPPALCYPAGLGTPVDSFPQKGACLCALASPHVSRNSANDNKLQIR